VRTHVKEAEFVKSQDYQRAKREFGVVRGVFSLVETLLFLYYAVLPYFWSQCSKFLILLDSPYFPDTEVC
jgi:CAAX prenyl protease N-terminal, five membrane helices